MTLTSKAYLEIEGTNSTATFEMQIDLSNDASVNKSYVMGERGQYLREIVNQTPGTGSFDASRRTGYWIDGGAGDWQETFRFSVGQEGVDYQWGDDSGARTQAGVATTDSSGSGIAAVSRKNIFDYWIAKSKSDSGGTTRMHFGEWSDGSVSHVTGVDSGAFNQPMPLAIVESNTRLVDPQEQQVDVVEGDIVASHVALWGGAEAPEWADDATEAVQFIAENIPDA